jgi:putative endonuclease
MALRSRIDTGRIGEREAARHLQRSGYRLLERNYRTREGEIDVIALGGGTLVFCEVKTLVAGRAGGPGPAHPLEGIRPAKRRQVRRMARSWLADRRESTTPPRYRDIRFDAIGVSLSTSGKLLRLDHLPAAF